MQSLIQIPTNKHNGLFDITETVKQIVSKSKIASGIVNVYVQGATAAIMIQENWDESVQGDVISLLKKLSLPVFGNTTNKTEMVMPT